MADEARAMLDALMGGDRDAPLPPGASTGDGAEQHARAPRRTKRSCFDRDICPLYCAWGVDVYELFKNTKSDTLVGINPNVVDAAAHEEFKALPPQEQERLGYNAMLFHKLQELVQKCDRTVNRNKEKLRQENAKQMQSRGGLDFVQFVDEAAVAQLAAAMVRFEFLHKDIVELTAKLQETQEREDELEKKLVNLLKNKAEAKEEEAATKETKEEEEDSPNSEEAETEKKEETNDDKTNDPDPGENDEDSKLTQTDLEQSLQKTRIEKQHLLVDLKIKTSQYRPLEESIQNQRSQLEYVKSDITSDKTVCEVSGNFMSARDADERIAAHYAGKQYVGWKLVRDKLKNMTKEYGRYGPPGGGRPPPRDDYRYGGRRDYHDRNRGRRSPSPHRWERGGPRRGDSGGDWRRDRGGGRRDGGHRWR